MKTISKFVIFFCAIALTACQDDTEQETIHSVSDIKIANGMIQSPQWLVDEVNRIADKYSPASATGEKLYPWVYSVKYNGHTYILVADPASGTIGHNYFSLSGESVEIGSDLYKKLIEAVRESGIGGYDGLVWRYENKSTSTSTRADQQIPFYTPNGTLVPDTYTRDEFFTTPALIVWGKNYYDVTYYDAEELSVSSSKYNCHGYSRCEGEVSEC
jgi:hypothetical protein